MSQLAPAGEREVKYSVKTEFTALMRFEQIKPLGLDVVNLIRRELGEGLGGLGLGG